MNNDIAERLIMGMARLEAATRDLQHAVELLQPKISCVSLVETAGIEKRRPLTGGCPLGDKRRAAP